MLPNWLGIGVGRSGTTMLTALLKQHPDIFMPAVKEAHFFNQNLDLTAADVAGYEAAFFSEWSGQPSVGEFTPNYLVGVSSVETMARNMLQVLGPQTRFIVSFRHPVRRAWSDHRFFLKSLLTDQPFAASVRKGQPLQSDESLQRSIYGAPLEAFLNVVPRENLFVTVLEEDIDQNLVRTVENIHGFLGVRPIAAMDPKVKINRIMPLEIQFHDQAGVAVLSSRGAGANPTQIEVPAGAIVLKTGWYDWDKVIMDPSTDERARFHRIAAAFAEPWDEDLAQLLFDTHFSRDVDLLEDLIGRDLSCWRKPQPVPQASVGP